MWKYLFCYPFSGITTKLYFGLENQLVAVGGFQLTEWPSPNINSTGNGSPSFCFANPCGNAADPPLATYLPTLVVSYRVHCTPLLPEPPILNVPAALLPSL